MADDMARKLAELNSVAELMTLAIAKERSSAGYYERAFKKSSKLLQSCGSETCPMEVFLKGFSLLLEQERSHERIMRSQLAMIRREIERIRGEMKK